MDEETQTVLTIKTFDKRMTERVSQDREDGVWMVIPDLRGKGMQVTHTHTGIAALISKLGSLISSNNSLWGHILRWLSLKVLYRCCISNTSAHLIFLCNSVIWAAFDKKTPNKSHVLMVSYCDQSLFIVCMSVQTWMFFLELNNNSKRTDMLFSVKKNIPLKLQSQIQWQFIDWYLH